MITILLAPLLFALAQAAPAAQHEAPKFDRTKLAELARRLAREAIDHDHVPGISIAIGQKDETFFAEAIGYVDEKHTKPLTTETRFPIGSLTRQFTVVAVLQLAEQKKLDLDDELTKSIPELKSLGATITLRQILSNTSGIPSWSHVCMKHPDALNPHPSVDEAAFFKLFADVPLEFTPGAGFDLDSAGYAILNYVIQRTAEKPYLDYIREHVLVPAALEGVDFCPSAEGPARFVQGIASASNDHALEVVPSAAEYATQSLCARPKDLLVWQRALVGRTVVTDPSSRTLMTPTKLPDGNTTNYGYALEMSKFGEFKRYAHSGGTPGFRVIQAYYSLPQVTIAILADSSAAPLDHIEKELARCVLALPATTADDAPLEVGESARYAGTYQIAALQLRIFERDAHMWLESEVHGTQRLRSQGKGVFVFDQNFDVRVTFDAAGEKSASFELFRGGYGSRAKRVE